VSQDDAGSSVTRGDELLGVLDIKDTAHPRLRGYASGGEDETSRGCVEVAFDKQTKVEVRFSLANRICIHGRQPFG